MQSGSKTSADLVPSDSPRDEKEAPRDEASAIEAQSPESQESESQEPESEAASEGSSEGTADGGAQDDAGEDREDDAEDDAEDDREDDGEEESLGTRSEIEILGGCKRRIKASVPVEKVRNELDKNYDELIQTVQIPGFRRGRVPRKLLEARFGDKIEGDVKEALLSVSLGEVLVEKALKVVGSPKFDNVQFSKDSDLSYEVDVEVWPEFDLTDYKGIAVEREALPVREEDIEEQLKLLQRGRARGAQDNPEDAGPDDIFVGKYHLHRDDVRVKTSEAVSFTPSSKMLHMFHVEDLPDRVKAWQRGSSDPLKIRVRVPATFSDEVLRGTEVDLEFVLEETQRMEYPELNDSFAESLKKGSLSELRDEIRESLEGRRRRREEAKIEEKVLEKIVGAVSMDLPEGLLESQKKRWAIENEFKLLREEGLSQEEVKERLEKEGEAVAEDHRRGLKAFFILEKIAAEEKIFATEEEVDQRLDLLASYYRVPVHKLREEMRKSGRLDELRHSLRHEKVQTFLRENAKITGEVTGVSAASAQGSEDEQQVKGEQGGSTGELARGEPEDDPGVAPMGSTS